MSKLTRLLSRITTLWAAGPRASVPHWLPARGHLQFPAVWAFPWGCLHCGTLPHQRQQGREPQARCLPPFQASISIFFSPTCSLLLQPTDSNTKVPLKSVSSPLQVLRFKHSSLYRTASIAFEWVSLAQWCASKGLTTGSPGGGKSFDL